MEEQQAQLPLELAPKSTIDREQPESQLQPPPKDQRAAGRRKGGKPFQALEQESQEPTGRPADVSESVSTSSAPAIVDNTKEEEDEQMNTKKEQDIRRNMIMDIRAYCVRKEESLNNVDAVETTPSMTRKPKTSDVESQVSPDRKSTDVRTDVSEVCKFNRKGMCNIHQLLGQKFVVTSNE